MRTVYADLAKLRFIIFLFIFFACSWRNAHAEKCEVTSPPSTTALVELYTSEGCSSCPPADKWLTTINNRFNTKEVIPIAFHVDYWDYLGWKDPFAQNLFSERQKYLNTIQKSRVLYTPQVMLQGKEVRKWSSDSAERIKTIHQNVSLLDMHLSLINNGTKLEIDAKVKFKTEMKKDHLGFFLALTESKLSTQITSGENKGKNLSHDHVVRQLIGPLAINKNEYTNKQIIDLAKSKLEHIAVVAFVQDLESSSILQAISLKPCS